jgi:outer membrane phospholipase A
MTLNVAAISIDEKKELHKGTLLEKFLDVNKFSVLEPNYLNFSNDAYEDSITGEPNTVYVAYKVSLKFPIFQGLFEMMNLKNTTIQPYVGFTGEYDSHVNRPSSPVVSTRQNPSVFVEHVKLREFNGINWVSRNTLGFSHESNGQVLRDDSKVDSNEIIHDKISIGWNYALFKSEFFSYYASDWMFSSSLWYRFYPRKRDTDDRSAFFNQSKGADFTSYRSFKLELKASYLVNEGFGSVNMRSETWLGNPSYEHFDLKNAHQRFGLAFENDNLPVYCAVNFGTSKYLANYWQHELTRVYELGLYVDRSIWSE